MSDIQKILAHRGPLLKVNLFIYNFDQMLGKLDQIGGKGSSINDVQKDDGGKTSQ